MKLDLKLGLGSGHIGSPGQSEDEVFSFLDRAVELGITFIDTARGYGLSEERIGRWQRSRNATVNIMTKCGYSVPGFDDWTPECIVAGVDLARETLQMDVLDAMVLHSCPLETLRNSGVLEALTECKKAGKVRLVGYSGENEALAFASNSGLCDVLETSVNLFDQWSLKNVLPTTQALVVAKRPLANVAWKYADVPSGQYAETYWHRMKAMNLDGLVADSGLTWTQVALRFAAFTSGVTVAIAGTANPDNLAANREIMDQGPLPQALVDQITRAFSAAQVNWQGEV